MARNKKMEPLTTLLADIDRQIHDLQKRREGVVMAIQASSGGLPQAPVQKRRATNVKQLLMELLEEVKETGLNATVAVDLASRRNEALERATVSSLLSRFKADDVVTYDGKVYRLKKFHSAAPQSQGTAMH